MPEIRDRATAEDYSGDSWDEIAKRVWGPKAFVKIGDVVGDGVNLGMILAPAPKSVGDNAYDVLANVALYR